MPIETQPNPSPVVVEANALNALRFYEENYSKLIFTGLGSNNKKIVLGSKPFKCRFCGGTPPAKT
jgi:hypothetical protein